MDSASSSGDESERENPTKEQQDDRDDTSSPTVSQSGRETRDESSHKSDRPSAHKRRRVTRACDECRRKKIKCDGKQPCTHCTVYGYECSYVQPSYRRKNPAPQYIAAVEQRLARAEAVIRTYLPNLDWNDPSLNAMLDQEESVQSSSRFQSLSKEQSRNKTSSNESQLESMVGAIGQLELDNQGHWDYTGHSSGLNFMRGMRDQLGDLNVPDEGEQAGEPALKYPKLDGRVSSPRRITGNTMSSIYESNYVGTEELPSKTRAKQLCSGALVDATAILEIIHQPSFYKSFDRIYDIPLEQYTNEDQKFLPLLYVVLALGCLFDADQESELERQGYPSATGIGYKYFWASRQLLDITDCRDLVSLQAIIFMILFLQCSAKLATCYSFVGVALRSALRMGLHRSFRDSFSPIEAECRKRAFWVIRKMDVYVGAMLGLPQTLNDDDIDQEYPLEIDDDFITDEGIKPMPEGRISNIAAANANFRICKIMSKIVRCVYPIKGFQIQEHKTPGSYSVSYTVIREIETDLQRWHESLPTELLPGENTPASKVRQQQLLRMAYAHAQLLLYRPFLHYVSAKAKSKAVNQRCYACAAACVSVSHNITHLTSEMSRKELLEGSYWFTMYTTFFAVLSLVFFALENPQSTASQDAFKDAKEGKETLAKLAKRSMAADRCSTTLKSLFEQIQPVIEKGNLSVMTNGEKSDISNTESLSQMIRDSSKFISEDPKGKSKSSGSAVPSNSQRGNAGQRQRGMRLISQTGRPGQTKQQQRSHSRNVPQPSNPQNAAQLHMRNSQPEVQPVLQANNSNAIKVESPSTASSMSDFGMPNQQQTQEFYGQSPQYSFMPTQYQDTSCPSNISNFSNMMFPSDNPFQYPHPPMNTLEQNYAFNTQGGYPSAQTTQTCPPDMYLPASTSSADTVFVDHHVDVQLLGPLQPYLMQPESNSQQQTFGAGMQMNAFAPGSSADLGFGDVSTTTSTATPQSLSGTETFQQQVQNQDLAEMDWRGFFGGDEWQIPQQ